MNTYGLTRQTLTTSNPRTQRTCVSCHFAELLVWQSVLLAFVLFAMSETAKSSSFVVDGESGPWLYVNGGLNSSFQYGVNDQIAPTVISTIGGIDLSAGQYITLAYQSGTVSANPNAFPSFFDANGDPSTTQDYSPQNPHGAFPAFYMASNPPVYYSELVGAFADDQGQIAGSPFAVGDGPTILLVPTGATRLQLGVNDNLFGDNRGSWTITAEFGVPEPSMNSLFGLGLALFVMRRASPLRFILRR